MGVEVTVTVKVVAVKVPQKVITLISWPLEVIRHFKHCFCTFEYLVVKVTIIRLDTTCTQTRLPMRMRL